MKRSSKKELYKFLESQEKLQFFQKHIENGYAYPNDIDERDLLFEFDWGEHIEEMMNLHLLWLDHLDRKHRMRKIVLKIMSTVPAILVRLAEYLMLFSLYSMIDNKRPLMFAALGIVLFALALMINAICQEKKG